MTEFIMGLVGVVVGAVITFATEMFFRKRTEKENQSHSATVLFYDLKSINTYVESNLSGECPNRYIPNIRYYEKWQNSVADCVFLSKSHAGMVYRIYGLVCDHNFASLNDGNTASWYLNGLANIMLLDGTDEKKSYDELMCVIEKHCKG